MPIKIGNEYFKVTNAWMEMESFSSQAPARLPLMLGVIFPKV